MERVRGIVDLIHEAVEKGSLVIEKAQKDVAAKPLAVLEKLPGQAATLSKAVHEAHDAAVTGTHSMIRSMNDRVEKTVESWIERVAPKPPSAETSASAAAPGSAPGSGEQAAS